MIRLLRAAGVFVLGSVFTSATLASPAMDAAFNLPGWSEDCKLPSATTSSPMIHDDAVQQASDNEPAAGEANHESCTSCNSDHSCSSCGCCGCSCAPSCYASAGVVILHRSRPNGGTIVGNNPFNGTRFSSGRDFEFGWEAGPDVTVGYWIDRDDAIEGRFFDDDGAEATNTFRTPGNFIGAGFTGPTNTLFEGRYTTQLYSSEINWKHSMNDRLAFLAGFRWIEVADEMAYKLNSTVAEGDYQYNNHLYGLQLGTDLSLTDRFNPLQLKATGKAGVYGNSTDGGIYEFQGANHTAIGHFTGSDDTTAFVGEVNLTASLRLTNHVAVRGGYQLLWLDDLALASDAAARSLLNPSLLGTVDNDQKLFYQGALVGVDFLW